MLCSKYNKFKSRTTLIFILFPLIQLAAGWFLKLDSTSCDLLLKAHQLWLLYYYTTLSLRENILWANGSDILHWWLHHHYLSMLIALIMLLWPNPYLVTARLAEMLWFGLVQGLVMLFQNNYQKKRLYVRKTLGKAKAIDIDSSETLVEKPTDLSVLIPMLFALYALELWFGVSFMLDWVRMRHGQHMHYPLSVLVMGVAFCVLAVGNAVTTGIVLLSKSKTRHLKQMVHDRIIGVKNNIIAGAAAAATAATAVHVEGTGSKAEKKE